MKLAEKLIAELYHFTAVRLAGGNAQDAKLIEAAKKEGGKVVVYGSLENDTMDLFVGGVQEKDRDRRRLLARCGQQSD